MSNTEMIVLAFSIIAIGLGVCEFIDYFTSNISTHKSNKGGE